jgi:hypothetical protein
MCNDYFHEIIHFGNQTLNYANSRLCVTAYNLYILVFLCLMDIKETGLIRIHRKFANSKSQ